MKNVYEQEIGVAKALTSQAEQLQYLSAVLRSMMQVLSVLSLEAVRELTPYSSQEANLTHLVLRFSQPSEGLYGEILESTIPIIRSQITRNFMTGWFENGTDTNQSFSKTWVEWVQFRNNKPGHGVVSRQDVELWRPKLLALTENCLKLFEKEFPVIEKGDLWLAMGDSRFQVQTPLMENGKAIVIIGVQARKGVWKINAQQLDFEIAKAITLDLGSNPIFDAGNEPGDSKFNLKDVLLAGVKLSVFHNIPTRQTTTFEGRVKELSMLEEWVEDEDTRFCLIYGDGGYGKTTLALEFLNRFIEGDFEIEGKFPSLISYYTSKMTRWTSDGLVHFKGVSDAMEDSVRELLFCMYPTLGRDWYKFSGSALIDKVSGELISQGFKRDDVLLVLDNTETLATSPTEVEELSEFLKKVGKKIGRVIVTSRRREFLPATPIQVSGLSDEEALRLMRRLAEEYAATAIIQAGDAKLRQVNVKLSKKPLLIDTLVKYIARSSTGIEAALDQILRKTNDQLLEFLYQDAWMRMDDRSRQVFLTLGLLTNPIDGRCVGDACQEAGLQHVEFQSGLDETYFATVTDRGATYDLEIVDLAKQFFRKQLLKVSALNQDDLKRRATKVDLQAFKRAELDRAYVHDRVADAFRSHFAKAAKIAVDRLDYPAADENFRLAIIEEPMNAALKDRYAYFLSHMVQNVDGALPFAREAVRLDPKSGDANVTLGLICYRLGDIESGDLAMNQGMANGKPQMLCYLRMGIARYHQAKATPYSRDAISLLKTADLLLQKSEKVGNADDYYYLKNLNDIRRYGTLIRSLRAGINRRDVSSKDAPLANSLSRGGFGVGMFGGGTFGG